MNTGPKGIAVMHHYEKLRLVAYPDPGSPFARTGRGSPEPVTIGWGDTGGWKLGDRITKERADQLFAARLAREFEPGVLDALQQNPTQDQFDAFVSLAYNIGVNAFRGSTALRKFNLGDWAGAADAILLWNRSNGQVMKGLQRRRFAERLVFQGEPAAESIARAEARYP
ncbi:MAG: lysozyme [Comamonadaceae bacterium]|nr:MAG: lysozyme [Comamonadaceae bacterium]